MYLDEKIQQLQEDSIFEEISNIFIYFTCCINVNRHIRYCHKTVIIEYFNILLTHMPKPTLIKTRRLKYFASDVSQIEQIIFHNKS